MDMKSEQDQTGKSTRNPEGRLERACVFRATSKLRDADDLLALRLLCEAAHTQSRFQEANKEIVWELRETSPVLSCANKVR